jgi:cytochrome c-type biogenesis protein CcmH
MNKNRFSLPLVCALPVLLINWLSIPSIAQESQRADRVKQIGGKFMCMCGCNQGLTQCNHVGCKTSTSMLKDIDHALQRGESEQIITQAFVQTFGTQVYAEPPKSGFSLVAWLLPSIYLAIGTVLVIFVITRWRNRMLAPMAAAPRGTDVPSELLERARARAARETED